MKARGRTSGARADLVAGVARRAVALALAVSAPLGCDGSSGRSGVVTGAGASAQSTAELPVLGTLPEFSLLDQQGTPAGPATFAGRPWVVAFVFTSCTSVCPTLMGTLVALEHDTAALPRPPWLVAISVDPDHDTPEVLRRFGEEHRVDPARWRLLTGDPTSVQTLVVSSFKQAMEPDPSVAGQVLHGSHLVLVDGQARIRGFYASEDAAALARLRGDLATLEG